MLDYMDEIVEGVTEFMAGVTEWGAAAIVVLAKIVILITAPAWILPYCVLKDRNGGKCENQDCDSCPFPPCEKEQKEND